MARKRPETVLDALNEIGEIAADVVEWDAKDMLLQSQRRAITACLQANRWLKNAAVAANSHALSELDSDPSYGDAWERQWRATKRPRGERFAIEIPLWYCAQVLKSLRECVRKDKENMWALTIEKWDAITRRMRFISNAANADSLEARVAANAKMREKRAEAKKTHGPKTQRAALAPVISLHA